MMLYYVVLLYCVVLHCVVSYGIVLGYIVLRCKVVPVFRYLGPTCLKASQGHPGSAARFDLFQNIRIPNQ